MKLEKNYSRKKGSNIAHSVFGLRNAVTSNGEGESNEEGIGARHENSGKFMNSKFLSKKSPVSRRKGNSPLSMGQARELLGALPGWRLAPQAKSISKKFVMKDFTAAVALIKAVLPIAQAENHHPDLHLTDYRKLKIVLSTHEVGGLSQKDFILAAKIDPLLELDDIGERQQKM